MNTGYAKSGDGLIHLTSALNSEFTICGDAFDGEANERIKDDSTCHSFCKPQPITCPKCIVEIKNIRGVKIKELSRT